MECFNCKSKENQEFELFSACSQCGSTVQLNKSQELVEYISSANNIEQNKNILISVPFELPTDKKKKKKIYKDLLTEGYIRFLIKGKIL